MKLFIEYKDGTKQYGRVDTVLIDEGKIITNYKSPVEDEINISEANVIKLDDEIIHVDEEFGKRVAERLDEIISGSKANKMSEELFRKLFGNDEEK